MAMAVAGDRVVPGQTALCAACGGTEAVDHLTHARGVYVACSACGLVRSEPLPRAQHMQERADYWAARHNLSTAKLERSFDEAHQRLAYGDVLRRLRPFRRTGRLLEIGCAAGGFLDAAQKAGWEPTGIELATDVVRYATAVRGLNVHRGTVESVALPGEAFDAAVMLDVIEHVVDPLALLETVRARLRPGGALVVMTPNLSGLGARWLRASWEACDPKDHLWLFDPSTLKALCRRAGFAPQRHWCIDVNPLQLVARFRQPHKEGDPAATGGTTPPPPAPVQRRNRLIGAILGSRSLQLGRRLVNAFLSRLDLGDKLYLLATKPERGASTG
ncbi:MAG: class I SAM-dependent methyltransferase [Planctomycetota bacterium]|jgi:2-polyprenyl-3-methyl-5-hydroxy-6-metoxy-1,4-benzoquinol methylase